MPSTQYPVDPTVLWDIAEQLLLNAGQAIDENGIEGYDYRYVYAGSGSIFEYPNSIVVSLNRVQLGLAGRTQFTFTGPGDPCTDMVVGVFHVDLITEVVQPEVHSLSAYTPPSGENQSLWASSLYVAGWTVFATYCQRVVVQGAGSQLFDPSGVNSFRKALIGPLTFGKQQGGLSSIGLDVQCQLL